jgi:hypothetical protein
MAEDYMISDEIDVGLLGPTKVEQGTDTNAESVVSVAEEHAETESDVSSSSNTEVSNEEATQIVTTAPVTSSPRSVATSSDVTLRDLEMVEDAFVGGCQTLQSITEKTGLSSAVVTICLKHLEKTLPISSSGNFYCTSSNLSALQKKLSVCHNCG